MKEEEKQRTWEEHKRLCEMAGLTRREYAQRNQISYDVFCRWCRKLKMPDSPKKLNPVLFQKVLQPSFYGNQYLKLCFPNGMILEIPGDFTVNRISEVVGLWV